jgi:hypothetical protein
MEENDKLYELILIEDESNIELIYQLVQGDETFSVNKLVNFIKDKLKDGKYYNMTSLVNYYSRLYSARFNTCMTMLINEDAINYYKELIGSNYTVKKSSSNLYTLEITICSNNFNSNLIKQSFYAGNINDLMVDFDVENIVRTENYHRFKSVNTEKIDKLQKDIYDILEISKTNYLQQYANVIEDELIDQYQVLTLIGEIKDTLNTNKYELSETVVDTKFKDLLEKGVFPLTYEYAGGWGKGREKYIILGFNKTKNTCSVEVQRKGKFRPYKNRDVDILFKQLKDYIQI